MKAHTNLFLIPFVMIICLSVFPGLANGSDNIPVEKLIQERTDTLKSVFFQQITSEKGEQLLFEIETQPILAEDIKSLRINKATEMDLVKDHEILVLEQTSDLLGYKSYRAEILWYMKGADGDYIQSIDYSIVLKRSGKGYKLSEFTPVSP